MCVCSTGEPTKVVNSKTNMKLVGAPRSTSCFPSRLDFFPLDIQKLKGFKCSSQISEIDADKRIPNVKQEGRNPWEVSELDKGGSAFFCNSWCGHCISARLLWSIESALKPHCFALMTHQCMHKYRFGGSSINGATPRKDNFVWIASPLYKTANRWKWTAIELLRIVLF